MLPETPRSFKRLPEAPRSSQKLSEPENFRPRKRGSCRPQLSCENSFFGPWRGEGPESSQEGKFISRNSLESHLTTRKYCKKRCSDDAMLQNPVFSRVISYTCFQNPVICIHFQRFCSLVGESSGHRRDQIKPKRSQNTGFWKLCN